MSCCLCVRWLDAGHIDDDDGGDGGDADVMIR